MFDGAVRIMSARTIAILSIVLLCCGAPARAEDRDPRKTLKDKGLMRIGSYHVLPERRSWRPAWKH